MEEREYIWSRISQHRVYHYRKKGNETYCGKVLGEGTNTHPEDIYIDSDPPDLDFRICSKCGKNWEDPRSRQEVYLSVIEVMGEDPESLNNKYPSFSKRQLKELEKQLTD